MTPAPRTSRPSFRDLLRRILQIPTTQDAEPIAKELPPERVKRLAELATDVRFASSSLPSPQRRILIESLDSIVSSRWRAHVRASSSTFGRGR